MGWVDTLRNALGFGRQPLAEDPDAPLRIADGGCERLVSLPEGHGIPLHTVEVPGRRERRAVRR